MAVGGDLGSEHDVVAGRAVDFALQAVEDAEYEGLDAIPARAEANEMAAAGA